METTTTNESDAKTAANEELAWRVHISGAGEFPGPNAEYCRRHDLDHRVFRAYKKKFGAVKVRVPAPAAFVKLQSLPERVTITPAARVKDLPDPGWTGKFIAALLDARR